MPLPRPLAASVEFVRLFVKRIVEHDALGLAAELAYRFMFAIFPFAIFLAALSSFIAQWLGTDNPTASIIDLLGRYMPPDLVGPVRTQLELVLSDTQPELLSIGAVVTLYAAAGGMNAVIKSLNRAFGVPESRPFYARLALAAALTVIGGAAILVSFVAIVGGTLLTQRFVLDIGWGGVWPVLSLLRWPMVFLLLVAALAVLLRLAPNSKPPWRSTLVGSAAFTVAWVVATYGLGIYVSQFASFDATYGALAGMIVLMLWFYVTGFLLVCAGELAALLASIMESATIRE